jgi:hypothetical protein
VQQLIGTITATSATSAACPARSIGRRPEGENDTLFNLNEAVATYQALATEGTPRGPGWSLLNSLGRT